MIEKILERLEEAFPINPYPNEFTNGRNLGIKKAIQIVQEVAKEYGNGWIPCSERLPELYTEVLVYGKEGYEYIAELYKDAVFGNVWRQWNGGCMRFDWIIAWQPLPQPYQKGE